LNVDDWTRSVHRGTGLPRGIGAVQVQAACVISIPYPYRRVDRQPLPVFERISKLRANVEPGETKIAVEVRRFALLEKARVLACSGEINGRTGVQRALIS